MIIPSSPNFMRLIRELCSAVDERNAAETLARLAASKLTVVDSLLAGVARDALRAQR